MKSSGPLGTYLERLSASSRAAAVRLPPRLVGESTTPHDALSPLSTRSELRPPLAQFARNAEDSVLMTSADENIEP